MAADWGCRVINPPKQRSTLQFAMDEIVVPTGDYKGAWRPQTQPWAACLFREMDSGKWPTIVTTGPSQSGKTQSCFAIPTIYTIAELKENFVLGVPDDDMADKKWRTDLLPILRAAPRLRELIPTEGPGSRGGKVKDGIQFRNGVLGAIMARGAGDATKAGFTARSVIVTEAADWSEGLSTSTESDPLKQLRARQRSYKRKRRRMLVEGTVKVPEFLPWRLRGEEGEPLISTMSWLATPCPHCETWVAPEREHFVGWQGAESEDQACNEATFICPACGSILSDEERRAANQEVKLVHYGQTIDRNGVVHGDDPPVSTLWFRYSQWNNLLLEPSDLAEDEWKAAQMPEGTQERDDAERELCQFQWCVPFRSSLTEQEPLKPTDVRKRDAGLGRNMLPDDTEKLVVGMDCGKWTSYWFAMALRKTGEIHVPAYGAFDVVQDEEDDLDLKLFAALMNMADILDEGFPIQGGGARLPDRVWVDGGWMTDIVARFIKARGTFANNRYRLVRGRGKSLMKKTEFIQRKAITGNVIGIGTQWFAEVNRDRGIPEITFDADYYKLWVQSRLRVQVGKPGSLSFFRASTPNEHAKVSHHLCSEQFVRRWEAVKGFVEEWVKTGANHWLDCAAMAAAAGDSTGWSIAEPVAKPAAAARPPEQQPDPHGWMPSDERPFCVVDR